MLALLASVACRGGGEAGDGGNAAAATIRPELRLTRSDGSVFDLADQRGSVVLLFFGYTHCPDVCPTTLVDFAGVRRRLGPRAERVRFVFVTVDPGRDTPQRAMSYARQFDSTFIGLSGDSTTLAAVQRSFRVASWVARDSLGNIEVAHSATIFLVDRRGEVTALLRIGGAGVDQLAAAVEAALGA